MAMTSMTNYLDDLMSEVQDGPLDEEVQNILLDFLGRAHEHAQTMEMIQEFRDDLLGVYHGAK